MKIIFYTMDPASGPLLRHGGAGNFSVINPPRGRPYGGGGIYHNWSIKGYHFPITMIKKDFHGKSCFNGAISPKTRPDVIVIRGCFTAKNPCENPGTPEPATSPVIPHFPHPADFRGHNFKKMRNRAGMIQRSPTGTDEVG